MFNILMSGLIGIAVGVLICYFIDLKDSKGGNENERSAIPMEKVNKELLKMRGDLSYENKKLQRVCDCTKEYLQAEEEWEKKPRPRLTKDYRNVCMTREALQQAIKEKQ